MTVFSVAGSTPSDGFELKSARFDGSDAYLERTFLVAGNRRTYTMSCWVKRGDIAEQPNTTTDPQAIFSSDDTTGSSDTRSNYIYFGVGTYEDKLRCGSDAGGVNVVTSAKFRDPAAWYHIVWVMDTPQATAADRLKIYVNGELQSLSHNTYPSQNMELGINRAQKHRIGINGYNTSSDFNGNIAQFYFVDGQALGPEYFGETNAQTNQWLPIEFSEVRPTIRFGVNGFYLPLSNDALASSFDDNSSDGLAVALSPIPAPKIGNMGMGAPPGNGQSFMYTQYPFVPSENLTVDVLVVGGGAGGGGDDDGWGSGGGGAGGVSEITGKSVTADTEYVVKVGAGGIGGNLTYGPAPYQERNSANGGSSSFDSIISNGGGYAGPTEGGDGGSGGAGSRNIGPSGATNQGNTGGATGYGFDAGDVSSGGGGCGGGGSGGAGISNSGTTGGGGGTGRDNSIRTGSSVRYAAGGGGGGSTTAGGNGGSGGGGNGAAGGSGSRNGGDASGWGSGGGGSGGSDNAGAKGGLGSNGLVVVRYQSSTVKATGGDITTYGSGGSQYYVHSFEHVPHTVTPAADATNKRIGPIDVEAENAVATVGPKQGNSSCMFFDGEEAYLEIPDSADWNFGSSDFTIEMWVNMPNVAFQQNDELSTIWSQANTTSLYTALYWVTDNNVSNSKGFNFYAKTGGGGELFNFATGVAGINNHEWNHVAVVRNGSSWVIYINGVSRATRTGSETLVDWSFPVRFGTLWNSGPYREWKGYLNEIRISNTARYTAAFDPPTAQFTPDANTKLLIHGDERMGTTSQVDSTPNLAFVPSADISVEYLVVGGGGAGAMRDGGGGGAGGYRTGTGLALTSGTSYAVQVGAGGGGSLVPYDDMCPGQDGSPSIFHNITADGGGGAGGGGSGENNYGRTGGSGGGAGGHASSAYQPGGLVSTAGYGNVGGAGNGGKGGGGGGSSAAGNAGNVSNGTGGAGTSNDISGSAVTYAAGGNGDNHTNSSPNATANSGNGSNGIDNSSTAAGAGGSGVVIITYQANSAQATGGTITNHGSGGSQYFVHTFTNTGHVINASWGSNGNAPFNVTPKFGTGVGTWYSTGQLTFNQSNSMPEFWIPGSASDANGRHAKGGTITYESWFCPRFIPNTASDTATYGTQALFASTYDNTSANYGFLIYDSGLKWRWRIYNASDSLIMGMDCSDVLVANTWYHIAFVLDGRKATIYRDGVEKGSVQMNGTPKYPNRAFNWGRYSRQSASNSYFSGVMDEGRISSTARYNGNFTPATAPFKDDKDTLLLMHMDGGGGIDPATNLATQAGEGQYFLSDAQNAIFYDSATGQPTNKSLMFCDGSGDNLSVPNSHDWDFSTNPYTWEAWINIQATPSNSGGGDIVSLVSGYDAFFKVQRNQYLQMRVGSGNSSIADGGDVQSGKSGIKIGQWYHVAAVREDATHLRVYADGVLAQYAVVSSADVQTSGTLTIGSHSSSVEYLKFLFDDVRVSNVARYTGTYTEPSAAFSSDAQTSLLLHCDGSNDGTTFTDSSSHAHTITVDGNIVTKTGEKKFGTASAYFNGGSGNELRLADDASLRFGTGDFTIEAWVYPVSAGGSQENMIVCKGDASTYWQLRHEENNIQGRVRWQCSVDGISVMDIRVDLGSTLWAYDTWHHIAVSATSTVHTLYVDGQAIGGDTPKVSNWDFNTGDPITIGNIVQGTIGTYGYIDELRISKGVARYTAGTYTVPTAPYTPDNETKLLVQSEFSEGGLGADHSGNYSYWTPNNLTAYDMSEDSPTNNFCTLTDFSFRRYAGSSDEPWYLSEGNLKGEMNNANHQAFVIGDMSFSSGKWYYEWYFYEANGTNGIYSGIGTERVNWSNNNYLHAGSTNYPYVEFTPPDGNSGTSISGATGAGAYGTDRAKVGDIIGTAFDLDNGKIYWSINGTWQNSGNPATGTNPGVANFLANGPDRWVMYWDGNASSAQGGIVLNCGQDSSFAGYVTSGSAAAQDDNDIGDFYYTPPAGFLACCTDNLAAPDVALPEENFNTVLYTGNAGTQTITGVGFKSDYTWLKQRNSSENFFVATSPQDTDFNKYLYGNLTSAEGDRTDGITAVSDDGFSLGSWANNNTNNSPYVAWNWKAGGHPTADNSENAGTTPTAGSVKINGANASSALAGTMPVTRMSVNTTNGISIVTYDGTSSAGTLPHGFSSAPHVVVTKQRLTQTNDWFMYHHELDMLVSDGSGYYIQPNLDAARNANSNIWAGTAPTASVFTVGTDSGSNSSSRTYIAWAFQAVIGYSTFGSYVGNGSTNGVFINCGFRPAHLIIKRTTSAGYDWYGMDNKVNPYNVSSKAQQLNKNQAEASSEAVDILSNGFKIRTTSGNWNGSNAPYIYLAWAESPFKYANAR